MTQSEHTEGRRLGKDEVLEIGKGGFFEGRIDADDGDTLVLARSTFEAHTLRAVIEELKKALRHVPMPKLSYEQVENRIAELQAKLNKLEENDE